GGWATTLCEADLSPLYRFAEGLIHFTAQHGGTPAETTAAQRAFPQLPSRLSVTARAILTAAIVQVADVSEEPEVADSLRMFRTVLSVPMLRDRRPLGAITVARRVVRPFTGTQVALLKTFADQAVIAIENVRLFTELQEKNSALTTAHAQVSEALDQQTATAEILRVISQSQTEVQPVFNTIVRSAMRLLGGFSATLRLLAGDQMDLVAFSTTSESGDEALRSISQLPLAQDPMYAQMVRDCQPCSTNDAETDPRVGSMRREAARARGYRSVLLVPMLRGGSVIGAIAVTRSEPGPFTDGQSALLQTFADQAVIAIENVRLFNETKEALEQQTATSEILRVIASSPTDIQPVFETIVRSAVR